MVRPNRYEHAGAAAASILGTRTGQIPEAALISSECGKRLVAAVASRIKNIGSCVWPYSQPMGGIRTEPKTKRPRLIRVMGR